MVQRDDDDEEEGITGCCIPFLTSFLHIYWSSSHLLNLDPQPFIFDSPHKLLEKEFYKRRLSGLSLHPKEDFEKLVYRFRSKKLSAQHF